MTARKNGRASTRLKKENKKRQKSAPKKPKKRARRAEAGAWFEKLVGVMARLRGPGGCPWDREQTHATLRTYLIEEAYEVLDALDGADDVKFAEELGDLLLQVVFHAEMAEEEGRFNIVDVIREIYEKMVRRHPHVFGEKEARDAAEVLRNWEIIKKEERAAKGAVEEEKAESVLDGVPRSLPGLLEGYQLTRKAARIGFDWENVDGIFEKLREETEELQQVLEKRGSKEIEGEVGDILFVAMNLARFLKIDPEIAMKKASGKFARRFREMERVAREEGTALAEVPRGRMEELWEEAKGKEFTVDSFGEEKDRGKITQGRRGRRESQRKKEEPKQRKKEKPKSTVKSDCATEKRKAKRDFIAQKTCDAEPYLTSRTAFEMTGCGSLERINVGIEIRKCETVEEYRRCVEIEREVWSESELETEPYVTFVVARQTGGQVLGAFDGEQMVGFAMALVGLRDGKAYLHSHMTGVVESHRNRGIGRMLKLYQREEALGRGIRRIEWTFDPLETRNAHFNFNRLGAIARKLIVDFYGVTTSPLHRGLPTDRLLVEWELDSRRVVGAIQDLVRDTGEAPAKICVPGELEEWKKTGDPRLGEVQMRIRGEFLGWFAKGYAATGVKFTAGGAEYGLVPWSDF